MIRAGRKLQFHSFPFGTTLAWRFSSDGQWEFDGVVKRFEFHHFQAPGIRGVNLTILGLAIWFGWNTPI